MKLFRIAIAVLGLAGLGLSAQAECVYPEADPEIPDGSSASKDAMIEGQQAVKAYMADMEAYLACIKEENAAAVVEDEDPEVTAKREALFTKRYNAAVDKMHLVGAEFNAQVRAYKAQSE